MVFWALAMVGCNSEPERRPCNSTRDCAAQEACVFEYDARDQTFDGFCARRCGEPNGGACPAGLSCKDMSADACNVCGTLIKVCVDPD